MKKLLSIALLASLGFSSSTFVMPYLSYIDYSGNTIKDRGYDGGIYGFYMNFPIKIEVDGEYLKIKYKYNNPDYYEKDLTFVGNYFIGSNYKLRIGLRNMYIDQKNNNDSYDKVLFGDILYYKYLKYNFGISYYHSMYDGFHVNQITPHFGLYFGNYYSSTGSFYFNMNLNYISISNQNIAETPKDKYVNSDISITNYRGKWATTLKASIGKNIYKVANEGFVVYNLGEEYHYSFGFDVNYYIDKKHSIKFGYVRNKFEEDNQKANTNVFIASYSLSF